MAMRVRTLHQRRGFATAKADAGVKVLTRVCDIPKSSSGCFVQVRENTVESGHCGKGTTDTSLK
jgi:hypothetical protein